MTSPSVPEAAGVTDPASALAELWAGVDGAPEALDRVTITGADPVLPSVYPVGTLAVASVAAANLAAGELWRARGGPATSVRADMREAAISFRSERHLRIAGGPPPEAWAALSGDYPTGDGRWIKLHCNFEHHADAVVKVLGVDDDRAAVAAALLTRHADDVESQVLAAGGCAATMRNPEDWAEHPQGRAVATLPLVEITPLDDGLPATAASRAAAPERPLDGLRVLDLTRVIAGPVCCRILSSFGAEVMTVGAEHLPVIDVAVVDTGFGKRFCNVDLRGEQGREQLRALIAEADVIVQAYRPGALAGLGFGPQDVARLRPGIVYVSLSAYGRSGPWAGRRGFDSLVQMSSGIAAEAARVAGSATPKPLPAQALDHGTGWLAALGTMTALRRRQLDGGSWHVQVALARTARWLDQLGRLDGLGVPEPGQRDVADLLLQSPSPFGDLTYVRPPGDLEGAPPRWSSPPHRPGDDQPVWATGV